MMKDKVVEILGTLYTIHFDVPDGKMPEGADGCMDQSIHQIRIAEFESDRNTIQDMDSYRKKVLRHEIFYMNQECGTIAEAQTVGEWMKQSLIGSLFSHQSCSGHSKKLIAYEYKRSNESGVQGG